MSDNRRVAGKILGDAADTILRDRPGVHGSAENSFAMIGEMWSTYLRHVRKVTGSSLIRPQDVAHMMVQLKQARALYGSANNADNFVDATGYSALAGMLQMDDPDVPEKDQVDHEIGEVVAAQSKTDPIQVEHTGIDTRGLAERLEDAAKKVQSNG